MRGLDGAAQAEPAQDKAPLSAPSTGTFRPGRLSLSLRGGSAWLPARFPCRPWCPGWRQGGSLLTGSPAPPRHPAPGPGDPSWVCFPLCWEDDMAGPPWGRPGMLHKSAGVLRKLARPLHGLGVGAGSLGSGRGPGSPSRPLPALLVNGGLSRLPALPCGPTPLRPLAGCPGPRLGSPRGLPVPLETSSLTCHSPGGTCGGPWSPPWQEGRVVRRP